MNEATARSPDWDHRFEISAAQDGLSATQQAAEETFRFRGTHDLPEHLPPPSATWEEPFAAIAKGDQVRGHPDAVSTPKTESDR